MPCSPTTNTKLAFYQKTWPFESPLPMTTGRPGLQTLLDSLAFDERFDLLWIINDSYLQTGFAFDSVQLIRAQGDWGLGTGDKRLGLEVTVGLNDKNFSSNRLGISIFEWAQPVICCSPPLAMFSVRNDHLFFVFSDLLWRGRAVFSNEIADVPFWLYAGAWIPDR